ncbi:response regulator [Bacillus sp. B15-48]|uniref:response regulator n=1 Tax=Bacillus sp. B15-48 TaxID=1548601 RepID=UPI0019400CF8|nr:response regulator [Bacillus sp. B15-48]MBM4764808.1 response regulator [Bacillus sp. B15-48]
MTKEFTVLIVEDDFRVAEIHRQYVEKVNGFVVQKTVNSKKSAFDYLKNTKQLPDLLLLDIYIPDVEGLELFWQLRHSYQEVDIVAVTAANDVKTVQETLRGGIFDFIVKPFDYTRLEHTLLRYKEFRQHLKSEKEMSQEEINQLTGFQPIPVPPSSVKPEHPKGIDPITLKEIERLFDEENIEGITAVELSKQIGTSRSTARRYLEYFVATNKLKTKLIYGTVGRPERQYILRETYEQNE